MVLGRKIWITNPYRQQSLCSLTLFTRRIKYYKYQQDNYPVNTSDDDDDDGDYVDIDTNDDGDYVDIDTNNNNHDHVNINTVFNTDLAHVKRCHCVSIVLYIRNYDVATLLNYLTSIKQSAVNMETNLSDWLLRLYIHHSVFKLLADNVVLSTLYLTQQEEDSWYENYESCRVLLDSLLNNSNTEVYRIDCDPGNSSDWYKQTNQQTNQQTSQLDLLRIFRFLPLLDTVEDNKYGVATCAIREADGIVSNLDCHNLKVFQHSNKLFYLIPLFYESAHTVDHYFKRYASYKPWLYNYKRYIDHDYFATHLNLYDMLAGCTAVRGKIRSKYFYESVTDLISLRTQAALDNDELSVRLFSFDEELLLYMFKRLISVEIDSYYNEASSQPVYDRNITSANYHEEIEIETVDNSSNNNKYSKILQYVYERHNIRLLYFNVNDVTATLQAYVADGILTLDGEDEEIAQLSEEFELLPSSSNVNLFIDRIFTNQHTKYKQGVMYNVTTITPSSESNFQQVITGVSTSAVEREMYNRDQSVLTLVNTPITTSALVRQY